MTCYDKIYAIIAFSIKLDLLLVKSGDNLDMGYGVFTFVANQS